MNNAVSVCYPSRPIKRCQWPIRARGRFRPPNTLPASDEPPEVARRLGFVGRVEYRHVISQTGGAQYGLAATPAEDLLTIYAEAFERDPDPDDFSLEAIIAHERGHQLLARHPRLVRNLPRSWSGVSEEITASLLGSLVVEDEQDQQALILKALFEAVKQGLESEYAAKLLLELRLLLEKLL